jgi:DNA-binding transcriptional MerR regulator
MFIGELAKLSGASPKAIRHYESLGLLAKVKRVGVYRVYSDIELGQVKLIKQAQLLGFRLSELLPVLVGVNAEPDWHQLMTQIEQKRASIKEEIKRMRAMDQQLLLIRQEIEVCLQNQEITSSLPDSTLR